MKLYKYIIYLIIIGIVSCDGIFYEQVDYEDPNHAFKVLGGSLVDDIGVDIIQNDDGTYHLLGDRESDLSTSNLLAYDIELIKLSKEGNEISSSKISHDIFATSNLYDAYSIESNQLIKEDDKFLILGTARVKIGTRIYGKTILLTLDSDGKQVNDNIIFNVPLNDNETAALSYNDIPSNIVKLNDDEYLIIGSVDSEKNRNDEQNYDLNIKKYNLTTNTVVWERIYGGDGNDYGSQIIVDNENQYTVFGTSGRTDNLASTDSELLLFRINNLGDITESHSNETPYFIDNTASQMIVTPNNTAGYSLTANLNTGAGFNLFNTNNSLGEISKQVFQNRDVIIENGVDTKELKTEALTINSIMSTKNNDGYIIGGMLKLADKGDVYEVDKDTERKTLLYIAKTDLNFEITGTCFEVVHGFVDLENSSNNLEYKMAKVIPTEDDGYAAVGTADMRTSNMIFFLKLNSNGELLK